MPAVAGGAALAGKRRAHRRQVEVVVVADLALAARRRNGQARDEGNNEEWVPHRSIVPRVVMFWPDSGSWSATVRPLALKKFQPGISQRTRVPVRPRVHA